MNIKEKGFLGLHTKKFTAMEFICHLNKTHALTDRVDEQYKYSYRSFIFFKSAITFKTKIA